jgi:broad specificity phosphatase PhoE
MNIYLIRHGETEWNKKGKLQGNKDSPLTKIGKAQAKRVSENLKNILIGKSLVLTSPLPRALFTASVILSGKSLDFAVTKKLSERSFGDWEGKLNCILKENKEYNANKFLFNKYNVESYKDLIQRLKPIRNTISLLKNDYENLIIVSHQTVNRFLITILTTEIDNLNKIYLKSNFKQKNNQIIKLIFGQEMFEIIDC